MPIVITGISTAVTGRDLGQDQPSILELAWFSTWLRSSAIPVQHPGITCWVLLYWQCILSSCVVYQCSSVSIHWFFHTTSTMLLIHQKVTSKGKVK